MARPKSEAINELKEKYNSGELKQILESGGLSEAGTQKALDCIKFVCKIQ